LTRYYKVINPDGMTPQGYGRWPLPVKEDDGTWTPGEWVSAERPLKRPLTAEDLCTSRVLHIVRADQLLDWIGPVVAEVETDGEVIETPEKCGVKRARLTRIVETWNDRSARIFAVECAEEVLHLIDDPVSRLTCEVTLYVARCYADGEATDEELDAAWAAAWAAARDAARAAARDAAWDAARAAALAAARDAAWAAALAAARDASWDAAWDAARAAARAAAWDAARGRQKQRLVALIEDGAS
jgi:hypothetical protein